MKIITIFFALLVSMSANSAQYYPLVCKGGPNQKFGANNWATKDYKPGLGTRLSSYWRTVIFIKSGPAATDASGHNLDPGECAFRDRKLRNNEPRKLLIAESDITIEFNSEGQIYLAFSSLKEEMTQPGAVKTFWVKRAGDYFLVK